MFFYNKVYISIDSHKKDLMVTIRSFTVAVFIIAYFFYVKSVCIFLSAEIEFYFVVFALLHGEMHGDG